MLDEMRGIRDDLTKAKSDQVLIMYIIYYLLNARHTVYHTIWHNNFTVVKFYGSPLNRLDEKLLGF